MKPIALAAAAAACLGVAGLGTPTQARDHAGSYAAPAYSGQGFAGQGGYVGQAYPPAYAPSCGSDCGNGHQDRSRRRYNSYNGQQDVPGDFRCDAYWDANRTDCNAAWRDRRPWRPATHRRSYSSHSYGGPSVYAGQYGRPDVVYSGSRYSGGHGQGGSWGGAYHGHDHSSHAQYGRDPQRINWCCAEYRSYDPATGYYTAYSGQRIFCG